MKGKLLSFNLLNKHQSGQTHPTHEFRYDCSRIDAHIGNVLVFTKNGKGYIIILGE